MSDFTKQHNLTVKAEKNPSFYTDTTCEGCNICTTISPECFKKNDVQAYVSAQPTTEEQESRCREAATQCPSRSIGSNGCDTVLVYVEPPPPPEPEQPI